jgi:hypothetical protein
MFTSAIKMYLMSLGLQECENWSKEELLDHLDRTFKNMQKEDPDDLEQMIHKTCRQIESHMQMLREVMEQ